MFMFIDFAAKVFDSSNDAFFECPRRILDSSCVFTSVHFIVDCGERNRSSMHQSTVSSAFAHVLALSVYVLTDFKLAITGYQPNGPGTTVQAGRRIEDHSVRAIANDRPVTHVYVGSGTHPSGIGRTRHISGGISTCRYEGLMSMQSTRLASLSASQRMAQGTWPTDGSTANTRHSRLSVC
jgi:hypothetical protein